MIMPTLLYNIEDVVDNSRKSIGNEFTKSGFKGQSQTTESLKLWTPGEEKGDPPVILAQRIPWIV